MIRHLLVALCFALAATPASAGLNLGMKLACKRYGDAWNSGSRSAIMACSTADFAQVWSRVPAEAFATMPRGGSGNVLGTSKGNGTGRVTVSTSQGIMTFVLVGAGFDWTVADIIKPGDDGRPVSLKNYLDASLTIGEFMRDLKYVGGTSFHDSVSWRFQTAFVQLHHDQLESIRRFLPPINQNQRPMLQFDGNGAVARVHPPGGRPGDVITFRLVRDAGWRVDDYAIQSDGVQIASFRQALPVIATLAKFGDFVAKPESCDPKQFTTEGRLREALCFAQTEKPFPLADPGPRQYLRLKDDLSELEIGYASRTVRLSLETANGRCQIDRMSLKAADQWVDIAQTLTLKRDIQRQLSVASLLPGLRKLPLGLPTVAAVPVTTAPSGANIARVEPSPSTLTNASAEEFIPDAKPAVAKIEDMPKAPPAPAEVAVVEPAAASTVAVTPSRVYYVAPNTVRRVEYLTPNRPGLFRGRRHHR